MRELRAVRWYAPYDVRVEDVEEPVSSKETDALVRPTLSAICGTDLHFYRGHVNIVPGDIIGHEFLGVVEKVGKEVKSVTEGDRVLVSCWVADGTCWYCRHGYYTQCMSINLFGCGPLYGETLGGGDAELVRIPNADVVLSKIPDGVSDERAVLASDGLPASYASVVEADMKPGDTVAVIGCGSIGLLCGMCARLLGASQVLGIDLMPERLETAKSLGLTPINAKETDAADEVRNLTDGRGADLAIEAVGGGQESVLLAIEVARRKGNVSIVGFHYHEYTMPVGQMWLTEKRLFCSIGDPIRYRDVLMEYIKSGRLDPSRIITHRLGLDEAAKGFEMFDKKQALKVVLKP